MMDNFAKKLAAGLVAVSSRLSWWPRHSMMMAKYLIAPQSSITILENIRQSSAMGAVEWDSIIPTASKKGLMGHHSTLEMSLVDAARNGDAKKIEHLGSLLAENAEEMAATLGSSVIEFPESKFLRLLGEHVSSYTEMVRLKVQRASRKGGERLDRNTVQLAAFTAEWF